MMAEEELQFSHSGLVARSPEGHAAKGMHIKGDENAWIEIQQNTFTNWVNEQLRHVGLSVHDLQEDLCDGVRLIALVEVLQKRKVGRKIAKPINQHQFLENVQTALGAIAADGVKLVNIGNTDIVEGNLKLILGLIWSLILRYQIGRTKFPPKKFMLSWLQGVLPECRVANFTTDWNSGINLSALLDYCKPGLFPHWKHLDPRDRINNCRNAMNLAKKEFNVPLILQPEYLASPNLDELSGMTYISYFMKEDGPGYRSTLNWVRRQIPEENVKNFTTDWNDGSRICSLVRSLGASVPGYNQMSREQSHWEHNIKTAMDAGEKIGVTQIIKPKVMADPEVEHLGPMAYISQFQWVRPRERPSEKLTVLVDAHSTRVHQPVNFKIDLQGADVDSKEITAEVRGPATKVRCNLTMNRKGGQGTFVPVEVGMHQLIVFCEGEQVANCPINVRVLPDLSQITFAGIDPCARGSIVEVLINSNGAGAGGSLEVDAVAPSGKYHPLPVSEEDGIFTATFQPDEAGEWKIAIGYEGEPIHGSPFTCYCYDPHQVKVRGLDGAVTGHSFTFQCDTSGAGWLGEVKVDIVHDGRSIPHRVEYTGSNGLYDITFTPENDGRHKVYIYFNGIQVKGSPFKLRVAPTFDPATVTVSGSGLKTALVGQPSSFTVNCRGAGHVDVEVKIIAPSKKTLAYKLKDKRNGTVFVEFTCLEIGEHFIETRVKGYNAKGSPFACQAVDPRQVRIGRLPEAHVGHSVEFEIDCVQAGDGQLELLVNEGHVSSSVKSLGGRRYLASFVPQNAIPHVIELKFNGEYVPGNPWKCNVKEASPEQVTVSGEALSSFCTGKSAFFEIKASGFHKEDIKLNIVGPSKRNIGYHLKEISSSFYQVEFTAYEVGVYHVEVLVAGKSIPGSPFVSKGYDPSVIRFLDVSTAVVGQNCQFEVDASGAGEGELEISINDGEVPNDVEVLGGGRCVVNFTPEEAKIHVVDVKFNDELVPGCPLRIQVAEFVRASVDLRQLELIPVNKPARFDIDVEGGANADLDLVITSPSGTKLPIKINGSAKNGFVAEFIPKEVGPHNIVAYYGNTEVVGTPFVVKVYDFHRVSVGEIPNGMVGKSMEFIVDANQAGEGNLEITVSTQGQTVPTEVHPLGGARFAVTFIPEETFDHIINISFNREPVPGSPFRAKVQDIGRVASRITTNIHTVLSSIFVNRVATFFMHNVSGDINDIQVRVEGPQGYPVLAHVLNEGEDTFRVEFNPPITGEYRIHASFCGVPIPGSPFVCRVYDPSQIKVKPVPNGTVGRPVSILVETDQAGPGNLEVTVNKGQVPSSAQAQSKHVLAITFTPREAKPHTVDIKFNGEPVPGSPFTCIVSDVRKVMVSGEGLEKVPVGRPAVFTIDTQDDAVYEPEVKITGPHRKSVPIDLTSPRKGVFTATYTPSDVGDHFVDVRMNGVILPGSPFLVKAYDANKVMVADISRGIVGKQVYFSIDASQAGAGNLEIIVSVNNRNVPNYVQSEGNAKFRVNFKPQEALLHTLSVKFNGEHVPGSPFACPVSDSNQFVVSESSLKKCANSKKVSFTIDSIEKEGSLKVSVVAPSGRTIPVKIFPLSDGKYESEFVPNEVGPHQVHVLSNGEPIAGSPFPCNVYDVSRIEVTGLHSTPAGQRATFTVDASQAGEGTLELVITNHKSSMRAEVSARSRGLYDVTFHPQEATPHFVNISFNDDDVPGSPFHCNVVESYDQVGYHHSLESRIKESKSYQQESRQFSSEGMDEVDAAPSRTGRQPIKPQRQDRMPQSVISELNERSINRNYGIVRSEHEDHSVMHYEKEESVSVMAKGAGLSSRQAVAGSTATFDIEAKGLDDEIVVRVSGPDGKPAPVNVVQIKRGLYRVEYTTHHVGLYTIEAFSGNRSLFRNPINVEVCDPYRVDVKDLTEGLVGKEVAFKIDTQNAGKGSLAVTVRSAGHLVKHQITEIDDNLYRVSFTPKVATNHKIDIQYNGHRIHGFPRELRISDPSAGTTVLATGVGLHQARSTKAASFVIETLGYSSKDFDVIVTGPGESLVPVKCYQQKDGNLLAEFTPNKTGLHYIEVLHKGRPIKGSPFVCQVYNTSKIVLDEVTTTSYTVNEKISFRINRRDAGYAELDVTVTSPLGKNLPIDVRSSPDGECEIIEFLPSVPGRYKIAITYGGDEVAGSPIVFLVEDHGMARAYGDGLVIGQQDTQVTFKIDGTGLNGEPHVQVDGPDSVASCSIEEEHDGIFIVTYVPKEVGIFDVRVFWNDKEVQGSPFHPRIVDSKRVRVIGGWESLLTKDNSMNLNIGFEKKISFDITEAGPGKLTAEVRGPRGMVQSSVEHTSNNRCKVVFTPMDEGEYIIHLYISGVPLPNSPIRAFANGSSHLKDHSRVMLRGRGLSSANINEEAEFVIDGSEAGPGVPEVSLCGVKADIPVQVKSVGNNVYKASYTASVGGVYLLNVMWSGRLVRGCPAKVNVSTNADASKVICTGDGLQGGMVGKDLKTFIDTRKAGSGELAVQCSGPHKVAHCELYDHEDGTFTLFIKPQESGKHLLNVKFGGEHIAGSPFNLRIAGAPDASKVRVYGPGIEPGVLANYQSRFIVETRGAGAGQLTVRIRGPKGAFRVEMQRESQRDRTILCKYDPTEPGDYRIEVKWSGDHVPGSPFTVLIFDTQDELTRYKQGGLSTSGPGGGHYFDNTGTYNSAYGQLTFGQRSWKGSQPQM